jgi:hypothetical protein
MGSLPEISMSSLGISTQHLAHMEQNPQWAASPQYALGFIVTVSNGAALTYSVQITADQAPSPNGNWNDHQDFSGLSNSQNGNVGYPITGYRLNVTAYTNGTVHLGVARWP